jgi:uncharacterized protein (DUF4415 family)
MKPTTKVKNKESLKKNTKDVYENAPSDIAEAMMVGEVLPRDFLPPPEELKKAKTKIVTTIRLDADILEWFRSMGAGYQTKINAVLRAYKSAYEKQGR